MNEKPLSTGQLRKNLTIQNCCSALHGRGRHDSVTGALFTQVLPFYDERIVALYGAFERELYRGIKSPGRF